MRANNNVTLIGRAGSDPDPRYLPSGAKVVSLSLAVDTFRRDDAGNKITEWYPVVMWERQAELAGEMLKKGDLVSVVGSLEKQEWTADGESKPRQKVQVRVSGFQILQSAARQEGQRAQGEARPPAQGQQHAYQQAAQMIDNRQQAHQPAPPANSFDFSADYDDDMPF